MNVIQQSQREERNRNEPPEKSCSECEIVKPKSSFKPVPIGGRSHVCNECISEKKQKLAERRMVGGDGIIQDELWKQYDVSTTTSEKIRCLEALVKLRPETNKSSLDEKEVVAALMKSMRRKKKDASGG